MKKCIRKKWNKIKKLTDIIYFISIVQPPSGIKLMRLGINIVSSKTGNTQKNMEKKVLLIRLIKKALAVIVKNKIKKKVVAKKKNLIRISWKLNTLNLSQKKVED